MMEHTHVSYGIVLMMSGFAPRVKDQNSKSYDGQRETQEGKVCFGGGWLHSIHITII